MQEPVRADDQWAISVADCAGTDGLLWVALALFDASAVEERAMLLRQNCILVESLFHVASVEFHRSFGERHLHSRGSSRLYWAVLRTTSVTRSCATCKYSALVSTPIALR